MNKMRSFNIMIVQFLFGVFLFEGNTASAQTSITNLLEKGHQLFVKGQIAEAIFHYDKVLEQDSLNYDALYFKGVGLYAQKDFSASQSHLMKASKVNSKHDGALFFYLAECYFYQAKYSDAHRFYKLFLKLSHSNENIVLEARKNERKADFASKAILKPIPFSPIKLSENINSNGQDFNAYLAQNDSILYFCSHRPECVGGTQPNASYGYGADIFYSVKINGTWSKAQSVGEIINTADHEKECSLTADGKTMVFARHPIVNSGQSQANIYITHFENGSWTKPKALNAINTEYCDSWPAISGDGQKIYFASNRPGGFGGYDLYYSEIKNGEWQKPQNMGVNFNTPGDEYDLFISRDGKKIWFSSNELPGFGGDDVFMCEWNGNTWSKPINLGYPLNTPADEFDFHVSADGKKAYYNAKDRNGYEDIYEFVIE